LKKVRLGVNVDHVATLRQARGEGFPNLVDAAKAVLAAGADGLVCHLREDRRHIQDADVWQLKKIAARLDLEMAATAEMHQLALKLRPQMVTLVPEKRRELTTEGGLDVVRNFRCLQTVVMSLEKTGIKVSLFIEPSQTAVLSAAKTGASFIELHTGKYANAKNPAPELARIARAAKLAAGLGLKVNAGHGLGYNNVKPILRIRQIEELNIGFSIIARAMFVGLTRAVKEMKNLL
jgi:pyridoxine 5-phosphate synthase